MASATAAERRAASLSRSCACHEPSLRDSQDQVFPAVIKSWAKKHHTAQKERSHFLANNILTGNIYSRIF